MSTEDHRLLDVLSGLHSRRSRAFDPTRYGSWVAAASRPRRTTDPRHVPADHTVRAEWADGMILQVIRAALDGGGTAACEVERVVAESR